MKQIVFTSFVFLLFNALSVNAQMQFVDVPRKTQKVISGMINELKKEPPGYDLFLYNSISLGRSSFIDSVWQVFNKYDTTLMPKFYADNWRLIAKKHFNDSTGYGQSSFLYGIHKRINLLDSMVFTMFSEAAYKTKIDASFDMSFKADELRHLDPYVITYPSKKNDYDPILLLYFDRMGKLISLSPVLAF